MEMHCSAEQVHKVYKQITLGGLGHNKYEQ